MAATVPRSLPHLRRPSRLTACGSSSRKRGHGGARWARGRRGPPHGRTVSTSLLLGGPRPWPANRGLRTLRLTWARPGRVTACSALTARGCARASPRDCPWAHLAPSRASRAKEKTTTLSSHSHDLALGLRPLGSAWVGPDGPLAPGDSRSTEGSVVTKAGEPSWVVRRWCASLMGGLLGFPIALPFCPSHPPLTTLSWSNPSATVSETSNFWKTAL